jgi:hypothetical protein
MKIQDSTGVEGRDPRRGRSGLRLRGSRFGGGCEGTLRGSGFARRGDLLASPAVAMHALDGGEGAIILALALAHVAKVDAETGLLFLRHGFGDAGVAALVMAADVSPKFAVVGAGPLPGP